MSSGALPTDPRAPAASFPESASHASQLREDHDAALRIAALTARGAGRPELFEAVAVEASTLAGGASSVLLRVDDDGGYAAVARSGPVPAGTRTDVGPDDGVPITVDGRRWGALVVETAGRELPPAVERRLARFAALVSGAVAHAQARAELQVSADERTALRRIHAVAGRGGTGDDVLAAIAAEGSAWLGGAATSLMRRDADGADVVVASSDGVPPARGLDRVLDGLAAQVVRSAAPARVDDVDLAAPEAEPGVRGAVAVPVVIEGRTWGVFVAGSAAGPMPPDAEGRLARFTQSVTPTILSAQARTQLAEEQFALRRVAELVARGASSDEVFTHAVLEAAALAGGASVALARWESTDRIRIIASHGPRALAVGTQVAVDRAVITGWLAEADFAGASAPSVSSVSVPTLADRLGLGGSVVVPVRLAGALWGVLGASSGTGPLATVTEQRLHQFADLVAAALANAQARAETQALADEQAALRRVAELAAHDASAQEVLAAVAREASALAGVDCTILLRYEPDGSTEIVALAGAPDEVVVGARGPGDGDGAVPRVWHTGRPARIEDLGAMSGYWSQVANHFGYTTSVAVPMTIHGSLWGTLVAVGRLPELLTAIEKHLTSFAELAASAISAAQARRELGALAEEQAALGRVASLVVRGVDLDEVFTAVAVEASTLLGGIAAGLWRRDPDDDFVLVANVNCGVTVGFRTPPYPGTTFDQLLLTGEASRIPSFEGTPLADATRQLQIGPTATVPVTVEGRLWGAMTTSTWQAPLPADVERRLLQFAELAGTAIANAENKAKLTTSRARVVATADETRRRLQRDVHDSAQQRLVHTIIALKLARQALASGEAPDALVEEALVNAERASSELRDVVRGILPAALTRGGLRAGLESLLADLVLPVELTVTAPRCAAHTELTAYFVVAEALTNVVKHARASRAAVTVSVDGDLLVVEVSDDGVGGADPDGGTGLLGLVDRVDAVEGELTLTSPPGYGTTLLVHLPLQEPPPSER